MIQTSAPGKMILLGEYAVLEGAPAIVAAVDKFAHVSIEPTTGESSTVSAPNLEIPPTPFGIQDNSLQFDEFVASKRQHHLRYVKSVFDTLLVHFNSDKTGSIKVILDTRDFYHPSGKKYGFGGSAALTVALTKALYNFYSKSLPDTDDLFQYALKAHHRAQGKRGSGIDIAASVYGNAIRYKRNDARPPVQINIPDDLHILSVWSGKSASTSAILQQLEERRKTAPHQYQTIIQEMTQTSEAGCQSLEYGKIHDFLSRISEYYQLMENLGDYAGISVISPEHSTMHQLAQKYGAAYKPSGAGNGDIGLVFSDSSETILNVSTALSRDRFPPIPCGIVSAGVQSSARHEE